GSATFAQLRRDAITLQRDVSRHSEMILGPGRNLQLQLSYHYHPLVEGHKVAGRGHSGVAIDLDGGGESGALRLVPRMHRHPQWIVDRAEGEPPDDHGEHDDGDRKSTRLNSSHVKISYAV